MRTGTLREYAEHRGVSPPMVTKFRKDGRLVMVKLNGRMVVDFNASDQVIAETASHAHAHAAANSPPTSAARLAAADAEDRTPGRPGQSPDSVRDSVYRRAQAQEKVYNARLAEIAWKKEVGEVLDRSHVERTVFDLFRSLRDQAFQAPQRAALRVRNQTDVRAIETAIEEELRKAFDAWEGKMTARLVPAPARPRA